MPYLYHELRDHAIPYNDAIHGYHLPRQGSKDSSRSALDCPNRDGRSGVGGCIYCSNRAFVPPYAHGSGNNITAQLANGVKFFSTKGRPYSYLAYFQSHTNTYGSDSQLISLYEEALRFPGVLGLVIATRPDSISNGIMEYFENRFGHKASVEHPYLLVELGIESTCNRTLQFINREHSFETAASTVCNLAKQGIAVGAHIILGLSGENRQDMLTHADRLSELPINTLKIHQLQVVRGTTLARMYADNPHCVNLFTPQQYIELLIDFLRRLRSDIALDRFVSETPPSMLIAPSWGIKPSAFNIMLERAFASHR